MIISGIRRGTCRVVQRGINTKTAKRYNLFKCSFLSTEAFKPENLTNDAKLALVDSVGSPAWEFVMNSSILWPSNIIARTLESIHWCTDLPWSGTIILYTVALRVLLLPIFLKQTRSTILANNLKPNVQKIQTEAQALRESGKSQEAHQKLRELTTYMSQNGINPLKIFGYSLLPLPFFMSTFFAIRNMASQPLASMKAENFLWLTDLGAADPFYLLPALSTMALLGSLELARFASPTQNMSPGMKLGLRIFAAASFPITSFMPSALVLYFTISNAVTCLIQGCLANKALRRLLKVPVISAAPLSAVKQPSFFQALKDSYNAHLRQELSNPSHVIEGKPVEFSSSKPKY